MGGVLRGSVFLITGLKHFTKQGYINASKSFDNSVMSRDLKGRHCMVTGANQGIGFQTAQELAKRGCTLHMVCRNESRGQEAVKKVVEATGNSDVHLQVCDVSSLEAVRSLAKQFQASGDPLHVLVLNAGILASERTTSADGFEASFATNTLVGTFVLARLMEPVLRKSAPSRVIIVSSGGQYTEPLVVDDLQAEGLKQYDGSVQYARDKRRQVAIGERLAQLWGPAGVGVYSMHPGWTETDGVKTSIPGFWKTFGSKFRPVELGSDTIVYLALEDADKLQPGGFYLDRAPQAKHLSWSGTQYTEQQVDTLCSKLSEMGGLAAAIQPEAAASGS